MSLNPPPTPPAPNDAGQLLQKAREARQAGDAALCLRLADRLLSLNPRDVRALVLKGDALAAQGDDRSAASFFRAALSQAQALSHPAPDVVAELRRAAAFQARAAQTFEQKLRDGVKARGFDPERSSERFAQSLDLMTGRKQLYHQQPKFYLLPGLPQVQFQPRETVAWLADVEAAANVIRTELDGILAEPELFAPYVEDRANRPHSGHAGMLGNAEWSAVFLWKDGAEVPEIAARCPQTMKVLSKAPLCRIPGRSPSILFSKLVAGAKIPPHHGLINTRLICHLPLDTPPGCRFRVGNDTREWRDGQAWAFDDTIEHEADNTSDRDRTILIFDVWKPELSQEERDLVCALFEAIDAAGATAPRLGG